MFEAKSPATSIPASLSLRLQYALVLENIVAVKGIPYSLQEWRGVFIVAVAVFLLYRDKNWLEVILFLQDICADCFQALKRFPHEAHDRYDEPFVALSFPVSGSVHRCHGILSCDIWLARRILSVRVSWSCGCHGILVGRVL